MGWHLCTIWTWTPYIKDYVESYFFGGTWPTLTRTQITLRVCIPTEQEASSLRVRPTDVLVDRMEESSMHCPHEPVCQWYTVQGWSLQFLTSCKALLLGHWIPPGKWWNTNQHQYKVCSLYRVWSETFLLPQNSLCLVGGLTHTCLCLCFIWTQSWPRLNPLHNWVIVTQVLSFNMKGTELVTVWLAYKEHNLATISSKWAVAHAQTPAVWWDFTRKKNDWAVNIRNG